MKSKIAERIMKAEKIDKPQRQVIENHKPDPMTEVTFTATLKRYGFMKWLEDKGFVKPRTQGFQIFINRMGNPTYVSSVQPKNKDVCTLHHIKISAYPSIQNK